MNARLYEINANHPFMRAENSRGDFDNTGERCLIANDSCTVPGKEAEMFSPLECVRQRLQLGRRERLVVVALLVKSSVAMIAGVRIPASISARIENEELPLR